MSCRSQSDAYRSALTDRFTDLTVPKPLDLHSAELFKHQPLQDPGTQLRYLYLLPKTHNIDHEGQTVVRCQLLSDAEEQAPRYIGLSYTWGDPHVRRPVLVGDKVFHATENLAVALEHLQEDDKTIIFWIDALCIDQANMDEKSIQVQRMGGIFASAALVLAWLGPAADESDLALQELESFYKSLPESLKEVGDSHKEAYSALPLVAIDTFFNRPWFKRVWVGQEVALNKQVIFVCGQSEVFRRPLLDQCVGWMFSRSLWTSVVFSTRYVRFNHVEALPLRDFLRHGTASMHLSSCSDLESSDPRDFVYSFFGQLNDTRECGLRVDYTKTVEAVYTEFAEAVVRAGRIDWLSEDWRVSVNYKNLPSWVPDWSSTKLRPVLSEESVLGGNIVKGFDKKKGGKVLKISAHRIAQISRVVDCSSTSQEAFGLDPSSSVLVTKQEEERVMQSLNEISQALDNKRRWSSEETEEAVFQLSSRMSFATVINYSEEAWEDELYESFKAFRGLKTPPGDDPDPNQWRRDASRTYLDVLRDSCVKDFFVTSTDIVGTSQDEIRTGDWVCVLGGVRGGWVLREVEEGFYRIVSIADVFPWADVRNSRAPIETIMIV
jgi:hypothetical protein